MTPLRPTLIRPGLALAVSGLIALTPPVRADEKKKDPDPPASTDPGGNTASPNAAAPKTPSGSDARSKQGSPGAGSTSAPNSDRPTNSDGTPADADNLATGFQAQPGMRAQTNREELDPKITSTWVKGATLPEEFHAALVELPRVEQAAVVMRYRDGHVYYLNPGDWKIVRVAELDPGAEVTPLDSVLEEGDVVPEQVRGAFLEVPTPEPGTTVRVYNDTAYYLDAQDRILRTVRLGSS